MPKYKVVEYRHITRLFSVDAKNKKEAEYIARNTLDKYDHESKKDFLIGTHVFGEEK